jgi:ferredoxin
VMSAYCLKQINNSSVTNIQQKVCYETTSLESVLLMNANIYFFSGTGNSLWVAEQIAEKLTDANTFSMSGRVDSIPDAEITGFVFPVYCWGVPSRVLNFIRSHTFKSSCYFAVATNGGQVANTLVQIKKFFKDEKNIALSSGIGIRMPSNYIPWGEAEAANIQQQFFDDAKIKIDKLVSDLKKSNIAEVEKGVLWQRLVFSPVYKLSFSKLCKMDKSFAADSNCNGCGICKKVCPSNNITIENGKPMFHHKCEQCYSCLHWCPQQALQYGKKTNGLKRYHQPEIKLSDIVNSRNN